MTRDLGLLILRLAGRRGRPAVAALAAGALIAGWSRIYLGYHWPLDVVGGFLLGSGMASLAIALLEPIRLTDRERERPRSDRSERGLPSADVRC